MITAFFTENYLRFCSLLDSLIERLKDTRIDCGDHIHRRVEFLFGHSRFPCIRKASFHSGIAQAHDRHRKPDEHFLSFRETFHRMGVTIDLAKIGFLRSHGFVPLVRNMRGRILVSRLDLYLTRSPHPSLSLREREG
jgi:hypothetical protein